MAEHSFSEVVGELCNDIVAAVERIEQNYDAEVELHNVQAYILNLLDLVEGNPGIDAAADDLDAAATGLVQTTAVDGSPTIARRQRLLREAFQRFQQRVASARPSAKARHMGLA